MHNRSILDNLVRIKAIDKGNMCDVLKGIPNDSEKAIRIVNAIKIPSEVKISNNLMIEYVRPEKIIITGMGGSAIGGILLKDWLRESILIPIDVCMDYRLPAYADKKTLVIAISYSGNTEETVSSFIDAIRKQCMVVAVSSGGILSEFSKILGVPIITIPKGFLPRCAIPYLFFSIVVFMKKFGVLPDVEEEIKEAIYILKQIGEDIRPEKPLFENQAKKLALGVKNSIPIIYSFGFYRGVALRLKNQFNENSKTPSKYEVFPELNHNEIVGWMGTKQFNKHFSVILLRDKDETFEIKERIKFTKELVLGRTFNKVMEIYAHGETRLAKMLSIMYIGDFTSFYLAILYGIDPTPINIISNIKSQLNKQNNKLSELKARLNEIMM